MELYKNYLDEIESRKNQSLKPKPIDDGSLLKEIIFYIKDNKSEYRKDCLNYFIYTPYQVQLVRQKKRLYF